MSSNPTKSAGSPTQSVLQLFWMTVLVILAGWLTFRTFHRNLPGANHTVGERHPAVATELRNLGWLYREEGRYPEAERYLTQAIDVGSEAWGPEHPEVAISLSNLGWGSC